MLVAVRVGALLPAEGVVAAIAVGVAAIWWAGAGGEGGVGLVPLVVG